MKSVVACLMVLMLAGASMKGIAQEVRKVPRHPIAITTEDKKSPSTQATEISPLSHSATKALYWSFIPGGGQIYNGQAWKVPIIYGIFAGLGYFIYYNYDRMAMYRDEYLYRVNHNNTPNLSDYSNYPTSNIYSLYNSYNRDFQLMCVIAAGVYLLNLVDAYVFGHLYDFQIDDNISLNITPSVQPTMMGMQPTIGLTLNF